MKIFVVGSSKNNFLPLDNIREKFFIDEKHEGDNIDFLNPWYCELTGLYYLWKHCDDEVVGLEHYRRYFVNNANKLMTEHEIINCLKDYDIICAYASYSYAYPPKTWLMNHKIFDDVMRYVTFAKLYVGNEYSDTCITHLNGNFHCLGNMFVCKKELINEYCEFIFDVFEKFYQAEKYHKRKLTPRIIGYIAEFLFGAWLTWKKKKIVWNKIRMIR